MQYLVAVVFVGAEGRGRAAGRERAQMPPETAPSAGLSGDLLGAGVGPAARDLSDGGVRLVEARRGPDSRRALGIVRSLAGQQSLRRDGGRRLSPWPRLRRARP